MSSTKHRYKSANRSHSKSTKKNQQLSYSALAELEAKRRSVLQTYVTTESLPIRELEVPDDMSSK